MRRVSVTLIVLLFAPLLSAQEDQAPRAPVKNERGLLQINRQYFDLAADTGGDFYFWAPGEFATAALQVPIHRQDVLLSYGTLESKSTFEIPIESDVQEMTLFCGIQRKDLAVLIRPDGTVAKDHDTGVSLQLFQHMLIATVTSPVAGVWRLELQGAGTYAVTAHVKPGDDAPRLISFDPLSCKVLLSGAVKESQLIFVRKDATPISEYDGQCTLPKTDFRVMVRGLDAHGSRFQRVESPLQR